MKEKKEVIFGVGRTFLPNGQPASWWAATVSYGWDCNKQAFIVCTEESLGTGTVANTSQGEYQFSSCDEVNNLVRGFRELEIHYRQEYGE